MEARGLGQGRTDEADGRGAARLAFTLRFLGEQTSFKPICCNGPRAAMHTLYVAAHGHPGKL